MRGPRLRTTIKSVVAILCAACFLTMSLGSVSRAIAADAWETWPKKTTVPGVAPNPETDANRRPRPGKRRGRKRRREDPPERSGGSPPGPPWSSGSGSRSPAAEAEAGARGRRTQATNERRQLPHRLNLIPFPLAIGVLFAGSMFHSLPAAADQARRSPPARHRTRKHFPKYCADLGLGQGCRSDGTVNQPLHRGRGFAQRHPFADRWLHLAGREPFHHLLHVAQVAFGVVLDRFTPVDADNGAFLEESEEEFYHRVPGFEISESIRMDYATFPRPPRGLSRCCPN